MTEVAPRVLRDRQAQIDYLHTVIAALGSARLGQQFPPVPALTSHLKALCPHVHGGYYADLQVHPRSGLPTLRDWARVRADRTVASQVLATCGADAPDQATRIKRAYHERLVDRPLADLDGIELVVRRLDPAVGYADLRVRFDKLDGRGCFVRFAVELRHRDPTLVAALGARDTARAELAERLRTLLYPLAEADAEWALMRLGEASAVHVERVDRCSIGPVYVAGVSPEASWPFMGFVPEPGQCVASFGTDTAAIDVEHDRDDDPFTQLLADRLSPGAQQTYLQARQTLGYHVFKGRKFVASPALVAPLQSALGVLGTRNVVYPLRTAHG